MFTQVRERQMENQHAAHLEQVATDTFVRGACSMTPEPCELEVSVETVVDGEQPPQKYFVAYGNVYRWPHEGGKAIPTLLPGACTGLGGGVWQLACSVTRQVKAPAGAAGAEDQ